MDFALTEEQNELRELARKILEDRATDARLREIARSDERIDRELWRELARANLLGVAVAEEYGGSDFGLLALTVLLEEIGRTVAPVPALATLALGALPIAQFGSAEQKQRLLPGVVEGERFLTAALAEPCVEDPVATGTTHIPTSGSINRRRSTGSTAERSGATPSTTPAGTPACSSSHPDRRWLRTSIRS